MPSQVISDINPNSLGPLQPIRAPQVPISIPNPLSVAPFFQGQQLQQNERRLDQQDIAQALQEKQFDLAMSELMFRQTKEILDMGDMDAEDAYNQHTSRQSQGSGKDYGSQLGLNPEYPAHKILIDKANAQIGDFQTKLSSAMSGVLKGGDPKAITQLYADMKGGLMKSRQSIQNDPEYMKYAVQQQKYDRFVKGTAAEIAKGNSVDNIQRRRTEDLYKRFASGDHLTLRETQELEAMLSDSNIQEISFNQTKGREWLKAAIENAAKPINEEEGIDTNDPRLPGYGIVKHTKTWADPAEVMHQTVAAAATNVDLVKMFKATTGLDIRDKKNYGAFANFIATQAKPYIHPGGQFTTDVGAVIVDPTEVLKAKAAAAGKATGSAAQNPFGSDSAGTRAQLQLDDYNRQGLELAPGYGNSDIFDVSQMKPGTTIEEEDPNTGEVKIWQVQVDAQGNPVMEPDYDAKNKVIPGTEKPVKVGQPLLILKKRTTTTPSSGDDIGSLNNNPGNIRATPEQIRRGTVKVDNNGFIVFDTIEQGLEASYADNDAKISGRSNAMKTSPYMVTKYSKLDLNDYKDFATVEDLLNVRTPRTSVGGDNSNESVNGFLVHLENRGFPADLKLKELNADEKKALNKAIVEYESPSSFARLYNPKPTTPQPSAEIPTAPDAVQTRLLSGGDFSPEELVNEIQKIGAEVPGDDIDPVNKFIGGLFGGKTFSEIGELNTEIQELQKTVSAIDLEYEIKNKQREERGEPLLVKSEDPRYSKATTNLDKLQGQQSRIVNRFAPAAKDLLIERKFPEEARQSYGLYAEAIVDTLLSSTDEIDLEVISDLKGTMTESTVDGSELLIKETGKKAVRIPKSQLSSWVQQHARRSAFASTDPIELRRGRVEQAEVQQPAAPTTAPAKKTGTGIDW